MLLGFIAFCVALAVSWLVLGYVQMAWRWYERVAVAAMGAVLIPGWLVFLLGLLLPLQVASLITLGLLVLIGVLSWVYPPKVKLLAPPSVVPKRYLPYIVALSVAGVLLVVAVAYTHFLRPGVDGWYSAGYTWADLALHLSLVNWFAHQPNLIVTLPVYPDAPLTYPFITNLSSAWLIRLGMPLQYSVLLPSIGLLTAFGVLLVSATQRLVGSWRAGWISLPLVVLNGSNVGFLYFIQAWSDGTLSSRWLGTDYSQLPEFDLNVPSLLTSHLLPQRTFLLGSVVVLTILVLLHHYCKQRHWSLLWTIAVLVALLPFAHVHSAFVAIVIVGGVLLYRKDWNALLPGALAGVVVVAQLFWQFGGSYHSGFSGVHLWWYTPEGGNPIEYWARNSGYLLVLAALGVGMMWRRRVFSPVFACLVILGFALFVVGNFYQFHPNLWDTMKFFSYSFIAFGMVAAYGLSVISRRRFGAVVVTIGIMLLTASGALAAIREQQLQWLFLSTEEQALAAKVQELVPIQARILTTPRHNHPVGNLSGRAVMLGYEGWLWSYGIDSTDAGLAMRSIWKGEGNVAALRAQLGVDYAVISDAEKVEYDFNDRAFSAHAVLIAREGTWDIYRFTGQ